MEQQTATFEGWAIVELMGHNVIAGYVTEAVIGGTAMLRVDVPATDSQQPYTKFFSGAAVYAITPTQEDTARTAAERLNRRPIDTWIVPDRPRLAQVADVDPSYEPEDEYDDYDEDDDPTPISEEDIPF